MKKVRDIPADFDVSLIQTAEYQARLKEEVAEAGQTTLALAFTGGQWDHGKPLGELEYQILRQNTKELSPNWAMKHSIWEEGEEVCIAYGVLTLRGLIRWELHTVPEGTWLLPDTTDAGKQVLASKEK